MTSTAKLINGRWRKLKAECLCYGVVISYAEEERDYMEQICLGLEEAAVVFGVEEGRDGLICTDDLEDEIIMRFRCKYPYPAIRRLLRKKGVEFRQWRTMLNENSDVARDFEMIREIMSNKTK